ncbi:uncharacterized protein G2W53_040804 [Senna tora]|uniref:Uncharacterized protein n=1 Tax=Senna tora TaxID=362788 RepID=A0A834VXH3_9FABA|nr:uncharacterized protein G2W53_040804 [Senna tora]
MGMEWSIPYCYSAEGREMTNMPIYMPKERKRKSRVQPSPKVGLEYQTPHHHHQQATLPQSHSHKAN